MTAFVLFFLSIFLPFSDEADEGLTVVNDPPGLTFIENKNQWTEEYLYAAQIPTGSIYLSSSSLHFFLTDSEALINLHEQTHESGFYEHGEHACSADVLIQKHHYAVDFLNSNGSTKIQGYDKTPEYYNYFIGSDSSSWASEAFGYKRVSYQNMYPNIDLIMYSQGNQPKYDLVVKPGGDPTDVKFKYRGLDDIYIYQDKLFLETALGFVQEEAPVAYQVINGERREVKARYVLNCDELSFELPDGYDAYNPLIIDPLLIFSTYSGSTADNWGNAATPGENGNLYSAGVTNHNNVGGAFPATSGAYQTTWGGDYDATIIKFDSTGANMLFATFLGGSAAETPHSIIMDDNGDLVIFGTTSSLNFPTTTNAFDRTYNGGTQTANTVLYANGSDIFVAKLNGDGTQLKASTYLGGTQNDGMNLTSSTLTKNYGDQLRGDVITDDENNIYISSTTASGNLLIVNGFQTSHASLSGNDAIVFKFDEDLSTVLWSTYLGGTGEDAALSIQLDMDHNVFVAGGTTSSDFPTTSGAYQESNNGDQEGDGWIAHLDLEGDSIIHATYTGTSSYDQVYFIDLDDSEEVYVYGQTQGDFPRSEGVYSNNFGKMFVQKLSNDLSMLRFSTAFGSNSNANVNISPTAFLVNDCNNLYMTGWGGVTNQALGGGDTFNMPISNDAWQAETSGSDFYLMVLTDDATEFLYGTYLGGDQSRTHVDGGTSRFDKQGVVYHSVCAGCAANNATGSPTSDFPTTEGAWSSTNNSGNCNNAAFKFDLASLRARFITNSVDFTSENLASVCLPEGFGFENLSIGGEIFEWDFGDGTTLELTDTSNVVHYYTGSGRYRVKLTAIDENTCIGVDEMAIYVDVFEGNFTVMPDETICYGDNIQLRAYGGTSYFWFNQDTTYSSGEQFPSVNPLDTTTYYVSILDGAKGCEHLDTVNVNVVPEVIADFDVRAKYNCFDVPEVVVINKSTKNEAYFWDYGNGETSDQENPVLNYDSGVYNLSLRTNIAFCYDSIVKQINTNPIKAYNMISPQTSPGKNDKFVIQSPLPVQLVIVDRWGTVVFEAEDYQNNWDAADEAAGVYYYSISVNNEQQCKGWVQVFK